MFVNSSRRNSCVSSHCFSPYVLLPHTTDQPTHNRWEEVFKWQWVVKLKSLYNIVRPGKKRHWLQWFWDDLYIFLYHYVKNMFLFMPSQLHHWIYQLGPSLQAFHHSPSGHLNVEVTCTSLMIACNFAVSKGMPELRLQNTNLYQGSKLREKITFPSKMLQKILPFRPNFNLSDQQTRAF